MNRRKFFGFLAGLAAALGLPVAVWAKTDPLKEIIKRGEYRGAKWEIFYFKSHKYLHYNFWLPGGKYGQVFVLNDVPRDERYLCKTLQVCIRRGIDRIHREALV